MYDGTNNLKDSFWYPILEGRTEAGTRTEQKKYEAVFLTE